MTEVPTTEWARDFDDLTALRAAPHEGGVAPPARHGHAHFHAFSTRACRLCGARAGAHRAPRGMRWVALSALSEAALPSLMRKVISHHIDQRPVTGNAASSRSKPAMCILDEAYAQSNAEVRAGPYVMIAVSDTGRGITPDRPGKGVRAVLHHQGGRQGDRPRAEHGLRLRQAVRRPYQGLQRGRPRHDDQDLSAARGCDRAAAAEPAVAPPNAGGRETILVVEDDRLVRDYVEAQLTSLGYSTLAASNAAEALEHVRAGAQFDLLFTDVIMPGGMNGRELTDEIARLRPGTKVLFTSGYTEDAIVHHGRLDPGVALLNKPYRKKDLAEKIRQVIDALGRTRPEIARAVSRVTKNSLQQKVNEPSCRGRALHARLWPQHRPMQAVAVKRGRRHESNETRDVRDRGRRGCARFGRAAGARRVGAERAISRSARSRRSIRRSTNTAIAQTTVETHRARAAAGMKARSGSATRAACCGATSRTIASCAGTRRPGTSASSASRRTSPTATRAIARAG